MNKIYKVIWSKTRNCYVAVSELAKNHGKDSVRSEKRSLMKGMSALALCIALSLGMSVSVWAEDPETPTDPTPTPQVNFDMAEHITDKESLDSTKFKTNTIADGAEDNTVIGFGNTVNSGGYYYQRGDQTNTSTGATGTGWSGTLNDGKNMIVGSDNSLGGLNSIIIGNNNTMEGQSIQKRAYYNYYGWGYGPGDKVRTDTLTAPAENSTIIGLGSSVSGNQSVVVGNNSSASGDSGTLLPINNWNDSVNTPTWFSSIVNNHSDINKIEGGENNTALGESSHSTGFFNTAIGQGSIAAGEYKRTREEYDDYNQSIGAAMKTPAVVHETTKGAVNSTAVGQNAIAIGHQNTALGHGASVYGGVSETYTSLVTEHYLGYEAVQNQSGKPYNGGMLDHSITQTFTAASNSTAIGDNAIAIGNRNTAIGQGSRIASYSSTYYGANDQGYENSTAIGQSSSVQGNRGTAIGQQAYVSGENSTAIGQGVGVNGNYNIAAGSGSTIYNGNYNVAVGYNARTGSFSGSSGGDYNIAAGSRSTASGTSNTAYGDSASSIGYNSTALGAQSRSGFQRDVWVNDRLVGYAYGGNDTAVGQGSTALGHNNVAIGTGSVAGNWSDLSFEQRINKYVNSDQQSAASQQADQVARYGLPADESRWTENQRSQYNYKYNSEYNRLLNDAAFSQWQTGKDAEGKQVISDEYSTAIGVGATAAGAGQTAIGGMAKAPGWHSTAIGLASNAGGASAIAIGESATTMNGDSSIAVGLNSTAQQYSSIAIGSNSKADYTESVAIGLNSNAQQYSSIAIGTDSKAENIQTVAIGKNSDARGYRALAIGSQNLAAGDQSIAIGMGDNNNTQTYGYRAIAVGVNAHADTTSSIAIGDGASIDYNGAAADILQRRVAMNAIAVGQNAKAAALDGTAVGRNTQAMMRNATAYGNNAHANAWNSIAIGNKAIAGLGNKIYDENTGAVLSTEKVTENGLEYVTQGAEFGNSAVAVGNRARAINEYTTAVGAGTNAEGWHAVAVGDSNQATGKFSTAIGAGWSKNYTAGEENDDGTGADDDSINTEGDRTYTSIGANQAGGDYSTAAGYGNKTVGTQSNAFGKENEVSGVSSLGVGAGNKVGAVAIDKDKGGLLAEKQENTVSGYAVGSYNTITGNKGSNAGAFGALNEITGDNSYAIGNSNTVSGATSIAVGTALTVTGSNSGAFGDPGKLDGNSSYMIGNDNEIAVGSDYSFILGNNVKTTLPNTVVIGHHTAKNEHTFGENSVSLGFDAVAQEDDSVALGSKSVASRDITKEGAGYDVLTGRPYDGKDREGKAYKNAVNPKSPIWTPTRGEVAVGDVENNITRRITGVAAGSEDTDAVNVAQLKIATTGFQTHYYSVEIDDPDDPDGLGSNYDNLGATKPGSVAAGYYTSATGFNSTAVGNMTRAEDSNSVAVGHQAHAHSEDSTAIGVDADAYGKGAIAFGHQATSGVLVRITPNMKEGEEGYDPTKVKYEATIIQQTKDNDSYVFRARKEKDENNQPKVAAYNIRTQDYYEAKLNDNGNYDIGNKIEVKESDLDMGGIAMGSFAHSEGDRSLAVGRASGAYGEDSAAIGINSNALGDGGLAIGHGSSVGVQAEVKPSSKEEGADRANGFWTTEVERDATGNPKANGAIGGIAIGSYAHTEGTRALAVGRVASAYGENSTAMGLRSSAYGEGSMAFGHGVVAGNENEKYAAQVPDLHNNPSMDYDLDGKDGTHVQTSNVIGAVALGSYAEATGRGSLSVGRYSEAQSAYTVAMGIRAEAGEKSENAIAIGREAKVAAGSGDYGGSNSIAMGTLANVKGMNSIAIGTAEFTNKEGTDVLDREERKGTSVTGNSSIAIGQSDTITGDNSIAIGTGHVIKGNNSGAFGDPNVVNADASYIIGNNSTIDGKDTKTGIDSGPVKDAFILGNDSNVNKSFGVALGSKTTVSAEGGVALGSESVASRDKGNGGAGAGFDVTTGKSYAGKGSDSATWTSTLAAVSVGGDSKDGSIGAAAKATRQITGVAAGTADTDAVNVAQLKLAVGGVTYTAGKNITIDGNVINATGSVYTANQTVEAGGPGEGRTTLNITDGDGGDAGSMTVKAGKNVTITEEKESGKSIAVINATDTTYTVTSEAGDAGTNVVNNYTMTGTNGDKYTFSDTDTTYTADQVVNAGTGWKNDEGGSTTFTITDSSGNNLKPMTIKAGDNVKITKGENGEAVIQGNGLKNDENAVVYDENGEGSVTITDQAGNTTKITNIRSLGGEGIADSINYLGDRINNLDKKINKVGAGAAALAGLHPLDFDPDEKWDFSAAAGSYKGEHAVAIGAFYRPNEDTMFSVGGTIGNGNNMVNVGVSWKFGQKNRISANRISSAKEIIELRKNQEDVHSFLADAVAGNQLDLSKIQLFPDVEENHWAYDYVATMAGNGVLEGYPDGYFKGNRNMTRYEMAAVLYRLMQNGARLSDRALTEFAPELDRIRVDTITHHKDGTPHIQRVRTIKERVDEKADPSSDKTAKKKAKVKVAEKPVE